MIYLASPYSDPDPAVRLERYERTAKLTALLLARGSSVFSPIVYGHDLSSRFGLDGTWEFWERLDLDFLRRCDALWIYLLDGWERSRGVAAEVKFARERGISIRFVSESGAIERASVLTLGLTGEV